MACSAKDVLGALSFKHDGCRERIYTALKDKQMLKNEEIENLSSKISSKYFYMTSSEYPRFLINELSCPPIVVYYKGDLSLLNKRDELHYIGIVGSRDASDYGKKAVRDIVKELPKETVIVSGLAKGIDACAHTAAMDYGLKTIAVLGNGIDYIYPSENKEIYERILDQGGLILSEYPNLVKPKPDQFIFRNRIVAAISEFLLIGEAHERSGSSTTVNFALQAGKNIGCIPYPVGTKSLCNRLIKDGAALIESASDIMFEIGRK